MNIHLIALFGVLLLTVQQAKGDLPVHCLSKQIAGEWELVLNSDNYENNLSCGHSMPDKNTDHVYTNPRILPDKARIRLRLRLPNEVYSVSSASRAYSDFNSSPFTASRLQKFLGKYEEKTIINEGKFISDPQEEQRVGVWTMIYDEGFEIRAFNKTFFAFSKYKLKDNTTPSDQDDEQTKGYVSLCNETLIGWYYDAATLRNWGCFYGIKKSENIEADQELFLPEISEIMGDSAPIGKIVEKVGLNINTGNIGEEDLASLKREQLSLYQKFQRKLELYEMPHSQILTDQTDDGDTIFQLDYSFVDTINDEKVNSPWKAKAHENFMNKTHKHMLNLLGLTKFKQIKLKHHAKALKKMEENMSLRSSGSAEETKPDILNEPNRFSNYLSFLQMKETAKLSLLQRMKSLSKAKDNLEEPLAIDSNILQSDEKMEEFENKFMNFLEKSTEEDKRTQEDHKAEKNLESNPTPESLESGVKMGRSVQETLREEQDEMVRSLEKKVFGEYDDEKLNFRAPCVESEKGGIPRCFDWRNRSNVNYDTYVRHQGECGSCYAVAALSSIESRIRIKSNNVYKPVLSTSGVLSCSRYNQGCNGGYPELVAKYGKEYGFFETTCSPDIDSDKFCETACFKGKLWKIKDYGYVGKGYYGSTNEETMKDEIFNKGPVVVAINASPDLYYYSTGVFITNPKESLIQENGHPQVNPWQFTNHAVVCVGWGETMHEGSLLKYWILKNSWGPQWGESGYFRILRGVNLAAVENQAVFADPIVD